MQRETKARAAGESNAVLFPLRWVAWPEFGPPRRVWCQAELSRNREDSVATVPGLAGSAEGEQRRPGAAQPSEGVPGPMTQAQPWDPQRTGPAGLAGAQSYWRLLCPAHPVLCGTTAGLKSPGGCVCAGTAGTYM